MSERAERNPGEKSDRMKRVLPRCCLVEKDRQRGAPAKCNH